MSFLLSNIPVYVLVFFRVAGMSISAPLFGSARIPKRVKVLLSIVLALGLSPSIAPPHFPTSDWGLALAIGGELVFGLAIGMSLNFTFIACNWAGEIIGQQMGINLGEVFDPQYGSASSFVGDLYFMLTLVTFLMLNGHHAMLRGVHDSFTALPLLSVGMNTNLFSLLLQLLTAATVLAMKISGPMLLTMLVVDLALGFIGKTMPQFNVMSAGTSMKAAIGVAVLILSLGITSATIRDELVNSIDTVNRIWRTGA